MSLLSIIEETRSANPGFHTRNTHGGARWRKSLLLESFLTVQATRRALWTPGRSERSTTFHRGAGINLLDKQRYDNYYRRQNAYVCQTTYQFQEVAFNAVLVERTVRTWVLPRNDRNQWQRVSEADINATLRNDPISTETAHFGLVVEDGEWLSPSNVEYQDGAIFLGPLANGSTDVHTFRSETPGTRTTPAKSSLNATRNREEQECLITAMQLRGLNAQLWGKEDITIEELNAAMSIQEEEFTFPRIVRKAVRHFKSTDDTVRYGELEFTRYGEANKIVATDTLFDAADADQRLIMVTIPTKCALRHLRTAKDFESGIYVVTANYRQKESIYSRRLFILTALRNYRMEVDVNRYDFLTVMDIDLEEVTEDEFNSHRVGTQVDIDLGIVSRDDSLLDRIE